MGCSISLEYLARGGQQAAALVLVNGPLRLTQTEGFPWTMSEEKLRPPVQLVAAMKGALNNNPSPTAIEVLEAAEHLLDQVLRTDCETRASALDLLTVDALMTHALEIAAKDD